MDQTLVLVISASTLAILHTLVPDHELPLAMIGRAQNWTVKKMAGVTLIAGIIHISVSMTVGVIAIVLSTTLAEQVAATAHQISGLLLVGFGAVYTILAWRRKGHGHSHGGLGHSHGSKYAAHAHGRAPAGSGIKLDSEGKAVISGSAWIVAIVGIAPCFTLIPVLLQSLWYGWATILLVMIVYAVSTIGMMVILTSIALKTITFLTKLAKVEKYVEIIAGLIILTVGLWVAVPDLISQPHVH
jgi:nickel/cobalt exporter